jgi:hypothetical protein
MEQTYTLSYHNLEEGRDLDYEVEKSEIVSVLAHILYDEFFSKSKNSYEKEHFEETTSGLEKLLEDCDLVDTFFESDKDGLKEYFEDDAKAQLRFLRYK